MGIILKSDQTKFSMTTPKPFEQSITELESIVTRLEKGDLHLEDALQQFEQGIHLARSCQSALRQAEEKIEILSKSIDNQEVEVNEGQHD